jgi:hypothetical protein
MVMMGLAHLDHEGHLVLNQNLNQESEAGAASQLQSSESGAASHLENGDPLAAFKAQKAAPEENTGYNNIADWKARSPEWKKWTNSDAGKK